MDSLPLKYFEGKTVKLIQLEANSARLRVEFTNGAILLVQNRFLPPGEPPQLAIMGGYFNRED